MSTLTDKLPKLTDIKLPEVDLDEAKKPAFAAVGVLDLYIEQVKDLPAEAKKIQDKVSARFEALATTSSEQLKTLPAQLKTLPADVQTRVAKAQTVATDYYAKLAVRGERLVTQIRRQPATEAAIAEGKEAVKKAEAATVAAKKSAKAAEKAVEGAAAKIG